MPLKRELKSTVIIKRLLKYHVAPYKYKVMIAVLFMMMSALCSASIVLLVRPAVDQVLLTHNRQMLIIIPLIMLIAYSIKGLSEYVQNYLIKCLGQQLLSDIQIKMYENLLYADFLFLQSQSSGRLISRFTNDIILMRIAVSDMLIGCAKYFLSILLLIVIMFSLEPFLSMFVFLAFPFSVYPIEKLGRKIRVITGNAQEELSHFTSRLDETFFSINVIKSFCTEKNEVQQAKRIIDKVLIFYKNSAKLDCLTAPIMEILSGCVIACVLWYGGFAVIEGRMTTGALFSFISAFVAAYRPFKSVISLNVKLQEGLAAANRIFNILDIKPKIHNIAKPKKPKLLFPTIEFKNVIFAFNNKIAIDDLSIKVPSGKIIAFVGRSGSGKTTISNLLLRFFDPIEGSINIDGHNIKEICLHHLRDQIAIVTQDTMLFDDTIYKNITYGVKEYREEDVIAAATAADAHEFIKLLPKGYESLIGKHGATLSEGQKQRLAITRAFLKNAPILLLDEATSALDSRSEQSIINAIFNLRKGRTTIIITHRLSSIIDADAIVVMKQGKISEQGTHYELFNLKKEYYKLYNSPSYK